MKFKSKPVEIEAIQWTGDNDTNVLMFMGVDDGIEFDDRELWVSKSDRWCDIEPNDWIIKEPDGDGFYPCKPDIFEARWEVTAND